MNSNNISKYFPSDILKWMKINATPLVALKLMKVCKYFQHKKFPYRVIGGISREWDLVDVDEAIQYYTVFEAEESFKTDTLDIFDDCSLWITNSLDFYCRINPFSSFLSKIAVCEAKGADFQYQTLTLEEFKILSSSGTFQWVYFKYTEILNMDGKLAALENILQCLPNVEDISFKYYTPSILSVEDIANITISNLKKFKAYRVEKTFNFSTFKEFMKMHPFVQFDIAYHPGILDLSTENIAELEQYIKNIINEDSIEFPPPSIWYPGMKAFDELQKLRERYEDVQMSCDTKIDFFYPSFPSCDTW